MELLAAEASLDPTLKAAIIDASQRIDAFHRDGSTTEYVVDTAPGVQCRRVVRPIGRVGLYIPAGSAPLPSTMLMLGVPARIAGCEEVVVCTPPRADGTADPAVLFAASNAACAGSSNSAARRRSPRWRSVPKAFPPATNCSAPAMRG